MPKSMPDVQASAPHRDRSGWTKFVWLVLGSLFFSTLYTLLQEKLYRSDIFRAHGWLTYMTFMVYACFGMAELWLTGYYKQRRGSLRAYALIALLAVLAVYLTNLGLHTVPYTFKIVLKSCRVLPVMFLSVAMQGKRYSTREYVAAVAMVIGISLFVAGPTKEKASHHLQWLGIILLCIALLLDAVVANLEEKVFFRCAQPVTRVEALTYMSAFGSLYAFVALVVSGEAALLWTPQVYKLTGGTWLCIIGSAVAGYGAMSMMLLLIEAYGVTTTEVVKNCRKVLQPLMMSCTLLACSHHRDAAALYEGTMSNSNTPAQVGFSFLIFPKPMSVTHIAGAAVTAIAIYAFSWQPYYDAKFDKIKMSPRAVDIESQVSQSFGRMRSVLESDDAAELVRKGGAPACA